MEQPIRVRLQRYLLFLYIISIAFPQRCDSNPSRVTSPPPPSALRKISPTNRRYPLLHLGGERHHMVQYIFPQTHSAGTLLNPKGSLTLKRHDQITRVTYSNRGVNDDVAILTRKIVPLIALRSIATISRSKFRARAICQVYVALKDRYISD